jgi:DNA repair protein RecO (recombination protein O)
MHRSQRSFEAIVLKKINFGDADRIYTLLTKESGKVSAMAKGVRKITSRRSGNLDTLNNISVLLSESTSGFKTIIEVKTLNSFRSLKSFLDRSLVGYYFAELVDKSVDENSESFEIFNLLREYLEKLDDGELKIGFVTNKFEFLLMKTLGYEMSLDKLRSFGRVELNSRLKAYVKEALGEDFKSLKIDP